jgi:glycerol-3-phosphate acyltransferase PlsY
LAWFPTLIVCVVWLAVFLIWWYVSLASLVAAAVLPIAIALTGAPVNSPVFLTALLMTIFVFFTHRANISRLRHGEEHNFRRKRRST